MRRFHRTKAAVGLLLVGLVVLTGGFALAAEEEDENDPLIQMIVELVGEEPYERLVDIISRREAESGRPGSPLVGWLSPGGLAVAGGGRGVILNLPAFAGQAPH